MSEQNSNSSEPASKLKRILRGEIGARVSAQRRAGSRRPEILTPDRAPAGESKYKLLPAFWTIASVLSMIVNLVLLGVLLAVLQIIGKTPFQANDQFAGLLGGLYQNFAKMDEAAIISSIPVVDTVPLDIVVPVQTTTRITLAEPATINGAHVVINTGGVNIDADAVVTLPAGTPLVVALDFPLGVKDNIPIQLDVAVNIPLRATQLHEPFVGLQELVKPYYCLIEPTAVWNNVRICSPLSAPTP